MDYIQAITIIMCGIAIGAVAMHAHNWSINQAVARERQRAEKREDRLRSERDNYAGLYQTTSNTIQQMQVERANESGYEDGYRSCAKDMSADSVSASVNDAIFKGLQQGKSIRLGIMDR